MTNEFRNFVNTATGQKVTLPAHYVDLFDTLEPTDEDVECVDCNLPDHPEVEGEEVATEEPQTGATPLSFSEPAKRSRRNRNAD